MIEDILRAIIDLTHSSEKSSILEAANLGAVRRSAYIHPVSHVSDSFPADAIGVLRPLYFSGPTVPKS